MKGAQKDLVPWKLLIFRTISMPLIVCIMLMLLLVQLAARTSVMYDFIRDCFLSLDM